MEKTIEEREKMLIIKALKKEVQAKVKQARKALQRIDEKLATEFEHEEIKKNKLNP